MPTPSREADNHEFQRILFPWPVWSGLTSDAQAAVRQVEDLLPRLQRGAIAKGIQLPARGSSFWNRLEHRLSWASDATWPSSPGLGRHTVLELDASRTHTSAALVALSDCDISALVCTMDAFVKTVTERAKVRRTSESIGTSSNHGAHVIFPPVDVVEGRLVDLLKRIIILEEESILLTATTSLVALNNCHPYVDGNGRTARWLFHLVLWSSGVDRSMYFPLYEFFSRSKGGFLIRQRVAEISGDWSDLMNYMCDIMLYVMSPTNARHSIA